MNKWADSTIEYKVSIKWGDSIGYKLSVNLGLSRSQNKNTHRLTSHSFQVVS